MCAGALRVLFARVLSIKCDKISFRECAARLGHFYAGFVLQDSFAVSADASCVCVLAKCARLSSSGDRLFFLLIYSPTSSLSHLV